MKKSRKTVLFTLSMPGRSSWNGHWSGEGQIYCICRKMLADDAKKILSHKSYGYNFGDGWYASVSVKAIKPNEAKKAMRQSAGFCGYNWMVDSICLHGEIKA